MPVDTSIASMRAFCEGFLEIFVDSAFGGATVVVVVPVVVVPVVFVVFVFVVPDVVLPAVVPPDVVVPVVVVVPAAVVVVGVCFPAPPPGFDGFTAALWVAPLPPPALALPPPCVVAPDDWPPLVGPAELALGEPPFGAEPDLPCAETGATLSVAIAAAVAKRRNDFMFESSPEPGLRPRTMPPGTSS
jgi:hypothetical protein